MGADSGDGGKEESVRSSEARLPGGPTARLTVAFDRVGAKIRHGSLTVATSRFFGEGGAKIRGVSVAVTECMVDSWATIRLSGSFVPSSPTVIRENH